EAALDLLDKAKRLTPHAPFMFNYLCGGALALYRLGRYREAADMAESAGLRRPNYFQPRLIVAAALAHLGDVSHSRAAFLAAQQIRPEINAAWLKPLLPLRDATDFLHIVKGLHSGGLEG